MSLFNLFLLPSLLLAQLWYVKSSETNPALEDLSALRGLMNITVFLGIIEKEATHSTAYHDVTIMSLKFIAKVHSIL